MTLVLWERENWWREAVNFKYGSAWRGCDTIQMRNKIKTKDWHIINRINHSSVQSPSESSMPISSSLMGPRPRLFSVERVKLCCLLIPLNHQRQPLNLFTLSSFLSLSATMWNRSKTRLWTTLLPRVTPLYGHLENNMEEWSSNLEWRPSCRHECWI